MGLGINNFRKNLCKATLRNNIFAMRYPVNPFSASKIMKLGYCFYAVLSLCLNFTPINKNATITANN